MLGKRLINSNDAAGGACASDEVDILGDGSGVALYQLNWDGSDMSGNYDGTATNVSFVNGKIDSAGSFNGSSSYVSIPQGNIPVGAASRTFSMWIKTTQTTLAEIFGYGIDGNNLYYAININPAAGKIGTAFYANDHNFTASVIDGNWHHIVSVYNGSTVTMYVDGSSVGTSTAGAVNTSAAGSPKIGKYNYFGDIDQVRLFNKALSASEITTLYNETACVKTCTTDTPQLVSDCIAYYKLDGNADDSNGTATLYDGTPTNVSWTQGRLGSAAGFNGSSTSKITTSLGINPNNAFSMSFWIKSDLDDTWQTFASSGTSNTSTVLIQKRGLGQGYENAIRFFVYNNAAIFDLVDTTPLELGIWTHYTIILTGSAGNLYKNGTQTVFNVAYSHNVNYPNLTFGQRPFTPSEFFDGSIDQVRIYDRAITAEEVTTLYNEVACPSGLNFNPVLWTGDGSASRSIGGVGFQPDLVWTKRRSSSDSHHLFDSVRGLPLELRSDSNGIELTSIFGSISSFDIDGFSATAGSNGNLNQNQLSDTFVAWCWKAGGDAVTIPQGTVGNTIASDVSANVDAGFSIVKYTGTGNAENIGHGLSQAPELYIIKNLSAAYDWTVLTNIIDGSMDYLFLNQTAAAGGAGESQPTSTTFNELGNNYVGASGNNYIAYCFTSIAGYQKVDSYTGNGTTNVVNTGFQPRFVMIKKTNNTGSWTIIDNVRDSSNPIEKFLKANDSSSEGTASNYADFNSNGFTLNTSSGNNSGDTFIYLAIK